MNTAGLRFFSVYQGYGGAEGHKGEYANTVTQFADKIAQGERPRVFGDGSQTRDFTHVNDIVRGIEQTAEHELQGIYNLGTGDSYDFNTMIDMINAELNTNVEPRYVDNPLEVYVTTRWLMHEDTRCNRVETADRVAEGVDAFVSHIIRRDFSII
jgi:Nucleoside-diphosphate-sugar epimerases